MNDNNKHEVISDRIYLIQKGLDKLKHLVKINCDILKSGKMFNKMTFYYCECDPYQKNSIRYYFMFIIVIHQFLFNNNI